MSSAIPEGWKLLPLSHHASRISRKNDIGDSNVLTISAIDGLINQREYFNKTIASSDLSHYTLLQKGDFAYNKSYSHGYPVGVVRRLKRYTSGVLSPLYICFSIDSQSCDNAYLTYYFDSYRFEKELSSVVKEGARAHGLLNIAISNFFELEVLAPPLPEQEKIASILTSVDEVIENYRKQIKKLQDLKSATMDELLANGIGHTEFKNSELGRIPKVWEVKTIGELGDIVTGSTPSTMNRGLYGGDYMFASPADISEGMFISKTEKKLSIEGLKRTRQIPINAIMVVCIGSTIGKVAITTEKCASNQQINSIVPDEANPYFVYFAMAWMAPIIKSAAGTQAVPLLNKTEFEKIVIPLPPAEEQRKIGLVLHSINDHIENLKIKLSKTQSLKISLMQDLLTGKIRVEVN